MTRRPVARRPVFFAGVPPDDSGTGQLVRWLRRGECDVLFNTPPSESVWRSILKGRVSAALREISGPQSARWIFDLRWWLEAVFDLHDVILLHPQTIGMRRVVDLVRRRRRPPVLYLLDCGFFCIRSYNHLEGASGPCLECLGGSFDRAAENGCEPFPINDRDAGWYVRELHDLVTQGRLELMAQNSAQARLASRHFGVDVPVVGLWTADWDGLFDEPTVSESRTCASADVVFHGHCLEAKGAGWLIRVAARCPELSFLFPFPPPEGSGDLPPNCDFRPMTWNSGLARAVAGAAVVAVPSLWSAPVESALVKSLVIARAVAVADNPTAFASEIPEDVVLRLPVEPDAAAHRLRSAVGGRWHPNRGAVDDFVAQLCSTGSKMLKSIDRVLELRRARVATAAQPGFPGTSEGGVGDD